MRKSELKKPFTLRDFEREKDTNERLRMCLIQPEFFTYLNDKESRKFDELYQTFALVYKAENLVVEKAQIVKNVMPDISIGRAQRLVNDMQDVFEFGGDKNIKRTMVANFHWELAKKAKQIAETTQDLDYASRIAERAAKLEGLDKIRDQPIDIKDIQLPNFIEISADPQILLDNQQGAEHDSDSEEYDE